MEKHQLIPDWCNKIVYFKEGHITGIWNICMKDWESDVSEQLPAATGICCLIRHFELSLKKYKGIKRQDVGTARLQRF